MHTVHIEITININIVAIHQFTTWKMLYLILCAMFCWRMAHRAPLHWICVSLGNCIDLNEARSMFIGQLALNTSFWFPPRCKSIISGICIEKQHLIIHWTAGYQSLVGLPSLYDDWVSLQMGGALLHMANNWTVECSERDKQLIKVCCNF